MTPLRSTALAVALCSVIAGCGSTTATVKTKSTGALPNPRAAYIAREDEICKSYPNLGRTRPPPEDEGKSAEEIGHKALEEGAQSGETPNENQIAANAERNVASEYRAFSRVFAALPAPAGDAAIIARINRLHENEIADFEQEADAYEHHNHKSVEAAEESATLTLNALDAAVSSYGFKECYS